ncbi:MAG: lysophospholipase [Solirubrobacteraceae bacterium]|nr:lysophospholipase [Solirubrobacteraceae bacterium]
MTTVSRAGTVGRTEFDPGGVVQMQQVEDERAVATADASPTTATVRRTDERTGEIAITRFHAAGRTGRGPCIVMAHGFGATVRSGLEGFGEAFAAAGYEVLAFDYRGFGASGGTPNTVSARRQVRDYRTVVAHARTLPEVDPDRIVVWGTSYSGGHVYRVAAADHRLAGMISMTGATDGLAVVLELVRRDGIGAMLPLVAVGVRDVVSRLRGRGRVMAPIVAPPGRPGALTSPGAVEAFHDVAGPDWRNEVAAAVFLVLASQRPGRMASRVRCPALAQVLDGDRSVPPASSIRAGVAARATIRRYPGDHFDPYPGQPAHADVLRDQLEFLARVAPVTAG